MYALPTLLPQNRKLHKQPRENSAPVCRTGIPRWTGLIKACWTLLVATCPVTKHVPSTFVLPMIWKKNMKANFILVSIEEASHYTAGWHAYWKPCCGFCPKYRRITFIPAILTHAYPTGHPGEARTEPFHDIISAHNSDIGDSHQVPFFVRWRFPISSNINETH